jgi:ELP3 family radical SAM enzyme/protein acetyltransferase
MDIEDCIDRYVIELSKYAGGQFDAFSRSVMKKFKLPIVPKKLAIRKTYNKLVESGQIQPNQMLESVTRPPNMTNSSGVVIVTISTKPDFSCKYNCYYCPKEGNQMPRSYLSGEPVLAHAMKVDFDAVQQFYDRAKSLNTLDVIDKIEVIVIGGTWSCYDHTYQEEFIRDIYYAANTYTDFVGNKLVRERLDLETEKKFNETSQSRIISITLETRPDQVTPDEIRRFRKYGCTRVQIGVQHINDTILKLINRGCYYADTVRAIKLLRDNSFKIDIHIMPNLPGSNPEEDIRMFDEFIHNPDLQADQFKIYPCCVLPFTRIKEWYEAGTYKPYSYDALLEVVEHALEHVQPYVRINRVIRDIPMEDIIAGIETNNTRDAIYHRMAKRGVYSRDIRYREVMTKEFDEKNVKLMVRQYPASDGIEYFISHESLDEKTIYSLLRLRINGEKNMCIYDDLKQSSLIREVHVYGMMVPHGTSATGGASQHRGLGKQLIQEAERITKTHNLHEISAISGVGVMEYYRKLGYTIMTDGQYLKKFI